MKAKFAWFQRGFDLATSTTILRRTAPFALEAVITTLMSTSGIVLSTILRDVATTGLFNAAYALVLALIAPLSIYNIVFLPALSRMHRNTQDILSIAIRKSQKLFFILGLPIALGGWFYAEDIMTLFYGETFRESAGSFEILVFTIATSTAALGMGTALAATNRQVLNLSIAALAAVTNVGLCIALIPAWGHVGASYAFLLANVLTAVLGLAVVHRLVSPIDLAETFPRPVAAGIAMVAVLFFLPGIPLWSGILAGALIYFLVLVTLGGLTRDDLALVRNAVRGIVSR